MQDTDKGECMCGTAPLSTNCTEESTAPLSHITTGNRNHISTALHLLQPSAARQALSPKPPLSQNTWCDVLPVIPNNDSTIWTSVCVFPNSLCLTLNAFQTRQWTLIWLTECECDGNQIKILTIYILQNNFFVCVCVLQKKECNSCLEQHEGE